MHYYVYLLTNHTNTVLYLGRTENLAERVRHHKMKQIGGFTKKYNVTKLVYYEIHDFAEAAAAREWKLKKWKREWKDNLVKAKNPHWNDLYNELLQSIN